MHPPDLPDDQSPESASPEDIQRNDRKIVQEYRHWQAKKMAKWKCCAGIVLGTFMSVEMFRPGGIFQPVAPDEVKPIPPAVAVLSGMLLFVLGKKQQFTKQRLDQLAETGRLQDTLHQLLLENAGHRAEIEAIADHYNIRLEM